MCRTGQNTELGEIADTLLAKAPPTDFELGTYRFGILIMRMTVLLVLFVILANAFFHRPLLESFLFAVALAVGLTPELLPMVVSVTLSRGALRMAANKAIVKRLASIQNLGSMDVFCTERPAPDPRPASTWNATWIALAGKVNGFWSWPTSIVFLKQD